METYIRKDDIESYVQECRENGETDLRSILYSLDNCASISIDIPTERTYYIPNEVRPHEIMCEECGFSIYADATDKEFTDTWKYCPCCGRMIDWGENDEL